MSKPESMSIKDYLIRILASKLMVNEKTIDKVISHQFRSASEAMMYNNSVEISGFAKFTFNEKKAQKTISRLVAKMEVAEKSMTDENVTEAYRKRASVIYTKTKDQLKLLKPTNSDND